MVEPQPVASKAHARAVGRQRRDRKLVVFVAVAVLLTMSFAGCSAPPIESDPYMSTYHAALVWWHPYPNLVIEVSHAPDREPSELALETMVDTLYEVTDKQSIQVTVSELPDEPRFQSSSKAWSAPDFYDLHQEWFTVGSVRGFAEGDTVYMHILYLNGHYQESTGERHGGVSLGKINVIFPDFYQDSPLLYGLEPTIGIPTLVGLEEAERYILLHEVGHSLGLVGKIPMLRERQPEPGNHHSTNGESVMYYGGHSHSYAFMEWVMDNQWVPYQFDQDDLDDLAAFRERGRTYWGERLGVTPPV